MVGGGNAPETMQCAAKGTEEQDCKPVKKDVNNADIKYFKSVLLGRKCVQQVS